MFNTHQIQILKDLIEDGHLSNLDSKDDIKDQEFNDDLHDIETILEGL